MSRKLKLIAGPHFELVAAQHVECRPSCRWRRVPTVRQKGRSSPSAQAVLGRGKTASKMQGESDAVEAGLGRLQLREPRDALTPAEAQAIAKAIGLTIDAGAAAGHDRDCHAQ